MGISGWYYYNHAALPLCAPHETPDISVVFSGDVWKPEKLGGRALLVRWTSDWDCGHETNFWYVIKDTPFDISLLKKKRRYEVNKGIKNFEVKAIDPKSSIDEIFLVLQAAYSSYPEKYRPVISRESISSDILHWNYDKVYGAYFRETNELCGYIVLSRSHENILCLNMQRVNPEYEKYGINAALIAYMLEDNKNVFECGGYISDGARNILHETNFQDYLEKYFGFRKSYCRLHIVYDSKIRILVNILYPFRKIFRFFGNISLIHKINGVLLLENILRTEQSDVAGIKK